MNNNNMNNKKKSKGRKNKNKNRNKGSVAQFPSTPSGNLNYQIASFNRRSPGRVRLKTSFTVTSDTANAGIDYTAFGNWNGAARSILSPFAWFRVVELTIKPFVYGGAASTYTLAFNYSNNSYGIDTTLGTIMNDDYSAFGTGINQPELHIPRSYLLDGSRQWYNALDGDSGVPSNQDKIQGIMSFLGAGGALSTTIVALVTVEMVLEFHTLL